MDFIWKKTSSATAKVCHCLFYSSKISSEAKINDDQRSVYVICERSRQLVFGSKFSQQPTRKETGISSNTIMIPCAFPLGIWTSVNPLKTFPDSSSSHHCLPLNLPPAPTSPAPKKGGALREEPKERLRDTIRRLAQPTFGISIRKICDICTLVFFKRQKCVQIMQKKSKGDLMVREIYFPIFQKIIAWLFVTMVTGWQVMCTSQLRSNFYPEEILAKIKLPFAVRSMNPVISLV